MNDFTKRVKDLFEPYSYRTKYPNPKLHYHEVRRIGVFNKKQSNLNIERVAKFASFSDLNGYYLTRETGPILFEWLDMHLSRLPYHIIEFGITQRSSTREIGWTFVFKPTDIETNNKFCGTIDFSELPENLINIFYREALPNLKELMDAFIEGAIKAEAKFKGSYFKRGMRGEYIFNEYVGELHEPSYVRHRLNDDEISYLIPLYEINKPQ